MIIVIGLATYLIASLMIMSRKTDYVLDQSSYTLDVHSCLQIHTKQVSCPYATATVPCLVVVVVWNQESDDWSLLMLEPEASSER